MGRWRGWGLALGGACALAAAFGPRDAWKAAGVGCTTHQCDGNYQLLPATMGTVHTVNGGYFWESAPMTGPWIDFPGAQTYTFVLPPPIAGNEPTEVHAYESPDPNTPQNDFIEVTGSNAIFSSVTPIGINVQNGSCAEYFLRVTAFAPAAAAVDAGGDGAEAGLPCPVGSNDWYGGEFLDATDDTWESNPTASAWVPFPGNTSVILHYPDDGRMVRSIDTWVSSSATPLGEGGTGWELASGDQAIVVTAGSSRAIVRNGTCNHDWARFEVHFYRADAGGPNPE